jgi:Bifunctional DNA primase/polymerase, N-terminal/Primase C terminal 1 (PriCT-1)
VSGVFSEWQPKYAARGIATFPIGEAKKPSIRGWQKVGLKGSAELADKFADADALGYVTGWRSKVTVLDIDTTEQKIAEDAIRQHGQPAIITRTASGKFHHLYRYNGERRRIRPWPDLPIDLLGDNGYALAAPSKIATGSYEIIHGHLDDLDRLKPMQQPAPKRGRAVLVPRGKRNDALFDHCRHAAPYCDSFDALLDSAMTYRDSYLTKDPTDSLTDAEVIKTANSAWKMQIENRNWIGLGGVIAVPRDVLARLRIAGHDTLILYMELRDAHFGLRERFVVANAMADRVGMTLRRLQKARLHLIEAGLIRLIKPGGRNRPPLYGWSR